MRLRSRTSTDRAQVEGQSCGQTEALIVLTIVARVSKEPSTAQCHPGGATEAGASGTTPPVSELGSAAHHQVRIASRRRGHADYLTSLFLAFRPLAVPGQECQSG